MQPAGRWDLSMPSPIQLEAPQACHKEASPHTPQASPKSSFRTTRLPGSSCGARGGPRRHPGTGPRLPCSPRPWTAGGHHLEPIFPVSIMRPAGRRDPSMPSPVQIEGQQEFPGDCANDSDCDPCLRRCLTAAALRLRAVATAIFRSPTATRHHAYLPSRQRARKVVLIADLPSGRFPTIQGGVRWQGSPGFPYEPSVANRGQGPGLGEGAGWVLPGKSAVRFRFSWVSRGWGRRRVEDTIVEPCAFLRPQLRAAHARIPGGGWPRHEPMRHA